MYARSLLVALAVAGVLGTAACSSGTDSDGTGPITTVRQFPATAPSAVDEGATSQESAYVRAIAQINPGLAIKSDRAIRRAKNICDKVAAAPGDGGRLSVIEYTKLELSGGDATVDDQQAAKVVALAKKYICD